MAKDKLRRNVIVISGILLILALGLIAQSLSIYPSGNVDWLENKKSQLESGGTSCSIEKCGRSYALFCGSDNSQSKIDSFCRSKSRTVRSFDEGECTSGSYEYCYEAEQEYGEASSEAKIESDGVYGFNIDGKWILEKDFELRYACDGDRAYLYDTQIAEPDCNDRGCSGYLETIDGTGELMLEEYAPIKPAIACWDRDDDDGWWAYTWSYIEANDVWYAGEWLCDTDNDCSDSQQCVIGNVGSICETITCGENQYVEGHQCKSIDENLDERCVATGIYTQLGCAEYLVQFEEVFDDIPEEVEEPTGEETEEQAESLIDIEQIIASLMFIAGVILLWI